MRPYKACLWEGLQVLVECRTRTPTAGSVACPLFRAQTRAPSGYRIKQFEGGHSFAARLQDDTIALSLPPSTEHNQGWGG